MIDELVKSIAVSKANDILYKLRLKIRNVTLVVTYTCTYLCKMCNIGREYLSNPEKAKNELSYEEIVNIFDGSRALHDLRLVILTGGEPFMRHDIDDLYCFFRSKYSKAEISIPTNSFNVKLILKKLRSMERRAGLDNLYLSISLDGMEELHDRTRGVPGAFRRAMELAKFTEIEFPHLKRGFTFTITRENYKDLNKTYLLSKKLNAGFHAELAQISGIYYMNRNYDTIRHDELLELTPILEKIISDSKQNFNPVSIYYREMLKLPFNSQRWWKCYSGLHSVFINAYGDVYPCIMLDFKLGNIRQSSFDNIWKSGHARKIRSWINKKTCNCWTPCEALPTITRYPMQFILHQIRNTK